MSEEGELDRALAERALAGEPAAQEEFASRMECMLHYLAWLNSKRGSPLRPDELMDLNGVVQLLVWKKLPKFEGRSRLETWALGFCRFEFLRALRERRKRARESETVDEREFETVSDDPVHPEAELAPYMKHLSPMQRRVVFLHVVDERQLNEIAAELGKSTGTTKRHWSRALEKLREVIGDPVKPA